MPMTGEQKEDVSLYFHIPFCSRKCPYCHFFVLPNEERFKGPFFTALKQEWALRLPQLQGKNIVSLYFGGGSPTQLAPDCYAILLEQIHKSPLSIASDCEITFEANPEDVTLSLMQQMHSLGINRVSLGIQSFIDSELQLLGRTHDAKKALQAIASVHEAGFTNLSLDLLYEIPTQTRASFQASLEKLSHLPITHLSLYNLTFEPHALFFKKKKSLIPLIASDTERLLMLKQALVVLKGLGLHRYEISAFARPGKESRHNLGYWTARPFLGFGPSAFSYWEGSRFSNTTRFHTYLEQLKKGTLPVDFQETLPYPDNIKELFAVQLRLCQGVYLPQFGKQWSEGCFNLKTAVESGKLTLPTAVFRFILPDGLQAKLDKLIQQGWLEQSGDWVRLTKEGLLFYDDVASELI